MVEVVASASGYFIKSGVENTAERLKERKHNNDDDMKDVI